MLAREAESLFWTGRYLQRAEDTARVLDVTFHSQLEIADEEESTPWHSVLAAVRLDAAYAALGRPVTAAGVAEFLVADAGNPGSIVAAVEQARANARGVREQLSSEVWEAINSFCLTLRTRNLRAELATRPHDLYGFVRRQCQTVAGVASATLARDEGWRFFLLGWYLERAEMACRLLRVRYRQLSPHDVPRWMALLRSASALEAYRRTYRGSLDNVDVVEFLLVSRTFPRSALYSLRSAEELLEQQAGGDTSVRPLRLLGKVRSQLEYADVRELVQGDLEASLADVEDGIRQVAAAVATTYFRNYEEWDLHSVHLAPADGGRPPRGVAS